ncbi:hypothetical protein L1987_22166 [Smallanthus sonchifolius]|uniref:Uncharacterized protein n=1 Tax=Smallanthus sonchifolius TaxID=185202 RepID=A0ACB9IEP8_9ASTR|nr:hypothetical protein L1987_22166 [Smallanthus sonchifolius]
MMIRGREAYKDDEKVLVEAGPHSLPSVRGSNTSNDAVPEANIGVSSIVPSSRNRADDIQAESKALARAVNASVYSHELLKFKYASRPFKVSEFPRFDYLTLL